MKIMIQYQNINLDDKTIYTFIITYSSLSFVFIFIRYYQC